MNIRKTILVVVAAVIGCVSFAQDKQSFGFGARVGINLADYTGSTGTSRVGFAAGIFGDYTISRFGLEAGIYYSQQGSFDVITQGVKSFESDYRLDYIGLQFLAKYQIFNGFRIFAGPEGSYLIKSTHSYTEDPQIGNVTKKLSDIKHWDVGIVAGAGYTFPFGLDLSASYSRGFMDLFESADQTAYNSMFRVSVGWRF